MSQGPITVDGLMLLNSIIRCSIPHTFYLGMYGQLGHGDSEKQSAAKMVRALEGKVVYLLACGNFHTVRGTRTVLLCSLCMHGWWNNPGYNLIRGMAIIACILNND